MSNIIAALNAEPMTREIPDFGPGDTVVVEVKVKEGDRERVQAYEGIVIAKSNRGFNSSFTVRKISHGEGVERVFQTHSPAISDIQVKRRGNVRRKRSVGRGRHGLLNHGPVHVRRVQGNDDRGRAQAGGSERARHRDGLSELVAVARHVQHQAGARDRRPNQRVGRRAKAAGREAVRRLEVERVRAAAQRYRRRFIALPPLGVRQTRGEQSAPGGAAVNEDGDARRR